MIKNEYPLIVPGNEQVARIAQRLELLLQEVPFITILSTQAETGPDLILKIKTPQVSRRLLVEFKTQGEPRIVRSAVQQLQTYLRRSDGDYGIIAAPYLSPASASICVEAGLGFLDLAGNCRLAFDQVFIEQKGNPRPQQEKRQLRSLFSPKATRALRVLLERPIRSWKVIELAQAAKISLGMSAKVKERLLSLELAMLDEDKRLRVANPEALLVNWSKQYTYRKNQVFSFFGMGQMAQVEQAIAGYCKKRAITYGLTLFSGAARVAPFSRYSTGATYVDGDPRQIAEDLGWKTVTSGANFILLSPFDKGVFFGLNEVAGDTVVSDIQLFLDLAGYKGRGEEAATFLLEERLKPRW